MTWGDTEKARRVDPILFVATGACIGFIPWAPGTWGTLWGLPLTWSLWFLPGWPLRIAVAFALFLVGIPLCDRAAKRLGLKDPGPVVWDEIVAMPVTFMFVDPAELGRPIVLVLGFALFRLFDITKPPPARQLEKLPGGLGIMADDFSAGVYACLVLHMILAIFW
ncbi:MAG: phosphatidylglycerophosphatase A [Planctomycetales bacterium]|nr:phosphatidylglycerophosphatase A [Planctomycetales bacterium]